MAAHKYIDRICVAVLAATLVLTLLFVNGEALGLQAKSAAMGYEDRLFDASRVHTIDIIMDDWEGFLETCENESYQRCTLVIDGETARNAAIRAKGNTSLTSVAAYGNDRYSFKVEFDHYDSGSTYYGLDKLSLNNLIQDNTCMKDFLVYQLMERFGAAAPKCSYASITVNGENWGLYLAVEGVEDAFLQRNYGSDHGNLYKPDSMSFGGGMGSSDVKLQYIDDDPDSYANIFDNAKTEITGADQTRLINALQILGSGEDIERAVDVEQVIRYFVVHGFVCNGDSYTGSMIHNYYLYEDGGVLSMIPWDYNLAFGGFQSQDASGAVNEPIDTPVSGGDLSDRPMVAWIFADEEYTRLYHQYYNEFLSGWMESGACRELIETTAAMIAPYIEEDPTKFCTYEEFTTGVEALKTFCELRTRSVRGQLTGDIPSTYQGQAEDASSLIEVSGLDLSDMGDMGMGGGGPDGQGGGMPQMPDGPETPEAMPAFAPGQGEETAGGPQFRPGDWQENGPQSMGEGGPAGSGSAPLLIVSVLVLAVGLAFVALFRRRR